MTPDDQRPAAPDDLGTSLDELASALVDGELDPATAAAARARPDVVARAAELAAARDALRGASVPPPDDAAREQAIAAALAAYDTAGTTAPGTVPTPTTPPAPPSVTPFEPRRRTGAPARRRRTWQLAAAAAVVVLAGVLGVALATSGDRTVDDTAATSVEPSDGVGTADAGEAAPRADEGFEGEADDADRPDAPAGRQEVGHLGTFASGEELADHLATALAPGDHQVRPEASDGAGAAPGPDPSCDAPPPPLDDPATPTRLHGHAVVDGTTVDVWVVDDGGRARLLAVDGDCRVVVDRPLP